MQEMIDAAIDAGELSRDPNDGYDFLDELLLTYLSLNPADTHKFVIRAFSDILVSLLSEERRICWRGDGRRDKKKTPVQWMQHVTISSVNLTFFFPMYVFMEE